MHAADFRILPVTNTTDPTNPTQNPWASVLQGTTIPSGANTSGVVDAGKMLPMNITTPSNLRGIATLTIQHSDQPNGTFTVLKQLNSATDYTITLTASSTIPIDTMLTQGLGYIKFVGNTTASGGNLAFKVGGKQAA